MCFFFLKGDVLANTIKYISLEHVLGYMHIERIISPSDLLTRIYTHPFCSWLLPSSIDKSRSSSSCLISYGGEALARRVLVRKQRSGGCIRRLHMVIFSYRISLVVQLEGKYQNSISSRTIPLESAIISFIIECTCFEFFWSIKHAASIFAHPWYHCSQLTSR